MTNAEQRELWQLYCNIIISILKKNLSPQTFEKMVQNVKVKTFTSTLNEFGDDEMEMMIDAHYFPFSTGYLDEMKEYFPDKCAAFILQNKRNSLIILNRLHYQWRM